jgi:RNA polymerase sigma factor (sigma-70 family)
MEAAVALAPAPRAATLQSENELVAAVRRGDDRAFEELYGRYSRRISSYIFGMVKDHARAEDLTQDVFVSALRRMRDTDRPIAFKPWIYEIAKNACIDQFRRNRRAEEVSFDADEGLGAADYGRLVTGDPTPDIALDHKQQLDHLRGALGGLSESHHQILVMREFEGLSYREIGEKMGMSRPSVESTLFRARKRLTEEYEELVTGARCTRIQGIISALGGSGLGTRDRRRMARHLSYCQQCRRHAHTAGVSDLVPARQPIGAKIAALLPLPAFLRRRWFGDSEAAAAASGHGGQLAQWSTNLGPMVDSAAGQWTKAVATAATIAVAGVGAGAATRAHHVRMERPLGAATLVSVGNQKATAPAPSGGAQHLSAAVSPHSVAAPPRSAAGTPTKFAAFGPPPASVGTQSGGGGAKKPAAGQQPADSGLGGVARQLGATSGPGDPTSSAPSSGGSAKITVTLPGAPTASGSSGSPATELAVSGDTKAATDVVDTAAKTVQDVVTGAGSAAADATHVAGGTLGG